MPRSAAAPISSWIRRRDLMSPARRCVPSLTQSLQCRNGGSDSARQGSMREIVFDTETTGLDPYQGHRLIEIGCYELLNRIPSGLTFHRYLNPERDVPAEAVAIHGLTADR